MNMEEKAMLKEHGMTDEEIKLITCPISMIPKGFLAKAMAARQHQLEIIEKRNEEWDKTHPRKSYLECEEGTESVLIRVEDGNTPQAKPKLGDTDFWAISNNRKGNYD